MPKEDNKENFTIKIDLTMTISNLTTEEYVLLMDILDYLDDKHSQVMNIEMLNGFLAALICAPRTLTPNEYIPLIWGGEMTEQEAFDNPQKAQIFKDLVTDHWHHMANTLHSSGIFSPLLLDDEHGKEWGNDWAKGFVYGMGVSRDGWPELLLSNNEEVINALTPILALGYEHDPDPMRRPYGEEPISEKDRETFIAMIANSVPLLSRYLAPHRWEIFEEEYVQLSKMLKKLYDKYKQAMDIERLDGFLAALICAPRTLSPDEYIPLILGGEMTEQEAFDNLQEEQTFRNLVIRHYNRMADTLSSSEESLPIFGEMGDGKAYGNNWAKGFMCGITLDNEAFSELLQSDAKQVNEIFTPILALVNEDHPDPMMRPIPINKELREILMASMLKSVATLYRYFAPHRLRMAHSPGEVN